DRLHLGRQLPDDQLLPSPLSRDDVLPFGVRDQSLRHVEALRESTMQRLRYARSSSLIAVLLASQLVAAHAAAQTPRAAPAPKRAESKPAASKPREPTEKATPAETAQPVETSKS